MTTTKLMANSSLEESIVTVNKRVWVKPAVELISVQSGTNHFQTEGTIRSVITPDFAS